MGFAAPSALIAFGLSRLAPEALLPALAVKAVAWATFPVLLSLSGLLSDSERRWLVEKLRGGTA